MMTLSPRAIALQGMGFAPLLVAVQGFASASPFKRAPRGAGYPARPVYGMRPMQANTVRLADPNTTRPRR
jgi:hypothetical protein